MNDFPTLHFQNFIIMKKLLLLLTAAFVFINAGIAQTKLVEKVSRNGSEIVIPYEKYILSNGLTFLLIVH